METRREGLTTSFGLLILRLGIGGYMLTHGYGKVQRVISGDFETFGDPIGLGSALSLALITMAETLCALAVMVGLTTRAAALAIACGMAVAAFVVHGSDPWTMGEGARLFLAGEAKSWASKEPALLYLVPFLALVLTGPGSFSVDRLLGSRKGKKRP